jgi:hypothetical protein
LSSGNRVIFDRSAVRGVRGRPKVTYADVAPTFADRCAGCHTVRGIAPFPLKTAGAARQWAQLIEAVPLR